VLSWESPATLADGSTATGVSGYRVYYGNASGVYTKSVYVAGSTATSAVVSNLQLGMTWYFIISAVDSNGNESSLDYEVSKAL
jgi:hypothetical protein